MNLAPARRWRVVIAVWLALVALTTKPAAAPSLVVAVVRPTDPGPMITEVVTRVHGELIASGFRVALIDHVRGAEPGVEMKEIANRLRPIAIFGIFEQPDRSAADIWVADLVTGKTLVRRVEGDAREGPPSKRGSSVQAVRAVELLRASLLELVVERSKLMNAPPTPPQDDVAPAQRDAPPVQRNTAPAQRDTGDAAACLCGETAGPPPQIGLEAGAAVLHSLERIGPSFSPILRVSYQPLPRLAFRASVAGLGTRATLTTTEGSAYVTQEFATLDLLPLVFADRMIRPVASVGVGVYHLQAEGSAESPYQTLTLGNWAAVLDVGGGGRIWVKRHVALSFEVHLLFASSYPMVRIADVDAGRAGRPSILGSLTLVAMP